MSTTQHPTPDFNLRQALKEARKSSLSSEFTMLDALAQGSGMELGVLTRLLEAQAGVYVVAASGRATPLQHAELEKFAALMAVPLTLPDHPSAKGVVALVDPWNVDTIAQVEALLGRSPTLVAAPGALMQGWLATIDPRPVEVSAVVVEEPNDVVSFVDHALMSALELGASDVHFEYTRAGLTVKLRQDGVMVYHSSMDGTERASEIISRIKVLAKLDITESRVPQDGRFRFEVASGGLDLRVSIMPSVLGEDAVLRLLDRAQLKVNEAISLDTLGFDERSARAIRDLADLPHGMMLVTGPTGSGKTTTVYAILSEVNNGQEKIITIEDPVEYELPGVLQIPVNERKNLTFAKGLRSILRHDPDRILVGEIRDAETAEIAVQSALTGHQVFTTVHANSIFDVTGRFRHFGLDMFGFMSALNGIIVQRLVRRLCPHCPGTRVTGEKEARWLASVGQPLPRVPVPVGCDHCRGKGYRGRLVIAEVHQVDDEFRDLVTGNAPLSKLREHVTRVGVKSLGVQAARLVASGLTTTEEVKRVVGWQ